MEIGVVRIELRKVGIMECWNAGGMEEEKKEIWN
jgi:hypothetical protein